jgi:phage repressor protein C with HTH and peptisase S24 domain
MSSIFSKRQIINELKKHYGVKKDTDFAHFLGIAPTTLSSWKSRDTMDYDLVCAKCVEINGDFILTGKQPMLKGEPISLPSSDTHIYNGIENGIPLIPISAMAGFGEGEQQAMEYECERYIVPAFKDAEFLIQVKGSSMYPKYSSGDIVACKKLPIDTFFQWNKVYVLDTVQGALIKRVKQGSDVQHILIVSENERYEPFVLSLSEVHSVAIVIGVIRLE